MSSKAAWSFVDYACGHSTPVRRGGAHQSAPRLCPDCRANARDPYICPRCHDTKGSSSRFCGGERCRNAASDCCNPVCPLAHPHAPYSRAVDDSR